jgi:hypothetical protein
MPFWVSRSSCAFLSAAIQPAVALLPVAQLFQKITGSFEGRGVQEAGGDLRASYLDLRVFQEAVHPLNDA